MPPAKAALRASAPCWSLRLKRKPPIGAPPNPSALVITEVLPTRRRSNAMLLIAPSFVLLRLSACSPARRPVSVRKGSRAAGPLSTRCRGPNERGQAGHAGVDLRLAGKRIGQAQVVVATAIEVESGPRHEGN